jgi:adenosylmethionine---8-amino-7-oxononanoate aminotransferase
MSHPSLWYPYTQMQGLADFPEVESARGVYLHLADGRRLIDGIASWWCMIHGYRHPELDQAIHSQLDRLSHVMLGGLTHRPARALADKLVEITPAGLNHVFFSDSGSVGVEVALKMAVQYWHNRGNPRKSKMIALKNAYHGDTCGCMAVCDPDEGMHALFAGVVPQQLFAEAPDGGFDAEPAAIAAYAQHLEQMLERHHADVAALIVEPLLQAAGGFNMYGPDYLRRMRDLCYKYDVLLIFDEVATGFGRTGTLFAADRADVVPDIMVLGKGLTGGYLGQAATIATTDVFDAFLSDDRQKAFMHGPTFCGNPLTCAVALKSIEVFQRDRYLERIAHIEQKLRQTLGTLQSPLIRDIRVLGATGVVEVRDARDLVGFVEFAVERGVWLRPLGPCLYTMPPYISRDEELLQVLSVIRDWFE